MTAGRQQALRPTRRSISLDLEIDAAKSWPARPRRVGKTTSPSPARGTLLNKLEIEGCDAHSDRGHPAASWLGARLNSSGARGLP